MHPFRALRRARTTGRRWSRKTKTALLAFALAGGGGGVLTVAPDSPAGQLTGEVVGAGQSLVRMITGNVTSSFADTSERLSRTP